MSLSYLIVLEKISNTVLNKSGKSGLIFFPTLEEMLLAFPYSV
jgi:hypothetical protein